MLTRKQLERAEKMRKTYGEPLCHQEADQYYQPPDKSVSIEPPKEKPKEDK